MSRKSLAYDHDPVFFAPEQVRVGTYLICVGRKDPGAQWMVTKVLKQNGRTNGPQVTRLSDVVWLESTAGMRRPMNFSYLRYAAHWRLSGPKGH